MGSLTFFDAVGVVGSLTIGVAYLAVSRGWVAGQHPGYNIANLIGSAMILMSLVDRPNAGAILVEIFWMMIAAQALVTWLLRRGR